MSLFAAKRYLKSPEKLIPGNGSSSNTHTSSFGHGFPKTKVVRSFTHQENLFMEEDGTSKKRKPYPARDAPEIVSALSASNTHHAVKGLDSGTSDHSNASKKATSRRQTKLCPFVKDGGGGGKSTAIARKKEPLINLDAAVSQEDGDKVKENLRMFRELCSKFSVQKEKGKGAVRVDIEALKILKKEGKWIRREKQFGHVPGIVIGSRFNYRAELHFVGLHCQLVSGIDFMELNGKIYAVSVVDSGLYDNKAESGNVLIYSGQGGNEAFGGSGGDQKLEGGNLALRNNVGTKYPVRVIRKLTSTYNSSTYVYDGLYNVKEVKDDTNPKSDKLVFKFELHRMAGQERLSRQTLRELSKSSTSKECCVKGDISDGKENMKISVMNDIDCERPPNFTYITKMMYPEGFELIPHKGCGCIDGCSKNLGKCLCVLKNGGEIVYNEKGLIPGPKDGLIYECGPFCKCASSCMNRVSQNGLRYKLELFKIGSKDWGVRSRAFISSGNFVCEFIGKLTPTKDTNENIPRLSSAHPGTKDLVENESGLIIDASKFGNVARFIRCSDSPNLFVQHIFYDNDDKRIPHVMFFAAKSIPPRQELTCDYSLRIGETSQWQYRLEL